jgi:hypothetical protein
MKMLSTAFRPIGQTQVTPAGSAKSNEPIAINKFGTLNNTNDPATLDATEFTALDNMDSVDGYLARRVGNSFLLPHRPIAEKVLNFEAFQQNSSVVVQLRFSKTSIYRRNAGSWTKITGVTFAGDDYTRFSLAASNDRFFCANGLKKVMEFDFAANTVAEIATSQPYKYIAAIGTRIVGAFNNDSGGYNPIEIGTSGNLNFAQWDPTVDLSAYKGYLYESQDSYTDFITGLAGVGETAVVMRERSIWLGEPQPSAQQPFYFYPKILNIGCDSPYTFQKAYGGVCFADRRTDMVYFYDPKLGQDPMPIGVKVYKEMGLSTYDPATLFSGWDSRALQYIIGIPQPGSSVVYLWKYGFKTQGWTRDVINNASSVSSLPYSTGSFTIDDAVGTIDESLVTIDAASPTVQGPGAKFIGLTDGHIYIQDATVDTDAISVDIPIDSLAGTIDSLTTSIDDLENHSVGAFTSIFTTKTFEAVNTNILARQIQLYIQPILSGAIVLSYSKDNGITWTTLKTLNFSALDKGNRVILELMKQIRARQLTLKFTATSGSFKVVKLTIENSTGGDIRQ